MKRPYRIGDRPTWIDHPTRPPMNRHERRSRESRLRKLQRAWDRLNAINLAWLKKHSEPSYHG